MLEKKNLYVKKIDNGYTIEYYFEGIEVIRAFKTWKETLDFLKDNPPAIYETFPTKDYIEVTND